MSSTDGSNDAQDASTADASSGADANASTHNQSNNTTPETAQDISKLLNYDPKIIERYIHYWKTGHDLNNPPPADAPPPPKKKKQKKKNIPPIILTTRGTIQLCCRDNNLPLALQTFSNALHNLTRMEAQVFYQLLNLCEGTFAIRTGYVHVGTPKNPQKINTTKLTNANKIQGEKQEDEGVASAAIPNISLRDRLHHAHQIRKLLHGLDIPLIEQAYTALVRLSSRVGDYAKAESYLDEAERTQQCKVKLRMYSSLLQAYCGELENAEGRGDGEGSSMQEGTTTATEEPISQERLVQALKVWKRMYDNSGGPSDGHPNYKNNQQKMAESAEGGGATPATLFGEGIAPKITLSECEYSALLKCATKLHDVPVMERLLSDVADEVLVPGLSTTEVVLDWFKSDDGSNVASAGNSSALDHVTLPPREDPLLGCVSNGDGKGWNIHRDCTIDSSTGKLTFGTSQSNEESGAAVSDINHVAGDYKLRPVELTNRAWNAMREMNSSIVVEGQVAGHVSQYQGGGKGKKRGRNGNNKNNNSNNNNDKRPNNNNINMGQQNKIKTESRMNAWKSFEAFIEQHPPYNIVIDGANVGYFEQNFGGSPKHVDYKQIDWLLRHLLEENQQQQQQQNHIILFMHERHFSPRLAPPWADPIIQSWDSNEAPYNHLTVYRTPSGMNDDWYWMHAALIHGGNPDKPSVLAITNDEMRDHHFQMLAQGSFLRWKERHQVHFNFGQYDRELRRREVLLQYPKKYSRRIQWVATSGGSDGTAAAGEALVIPLPKRGDEGRFADGLHVAEEGVPTEETYTVIQKVI